MPRLIAKCTALSLAVMLILIALSAFLILGGAVSIERAIVFVFIAEIIGAFIGGRLASRKSKLLASGLVGLSVFAVLLIIGLFFAFPPARHALLILPAAVVPALLGGLKLKSDSVAKKFKKR